MKNIHPAIAEHVMEENERLRGLLRELREITSEYAWDADLEARVDAALSQQSEPAQAQDEREAFEAWYERTFGARAFARNVDHSYQEPETEMLWAGWQARAARPAQTEQQPEQSGLVEAMRKAVEYLDENPFNQIGSGSILHRVMGAALPTQGASK